MSVEEPFAVALPASPFPGLRAFELHEWPIFFGRERMADEVVTQLLAKRVLVVHGDSGCGKSSLIRAAVLSRLEQEYARCGIRWRTCVALPREAPLWNLAEALAGLAGGHDEASILAMRRALNGGKEAPQSLLELLPESVGDRICILIDQFEELFAHARRHGEDEARLLTELIIALFERQTPRLYLVLTMRSEFLGACARYEGFAELVNATQYLVPRMTHLDLRRAICEPSSLFDGRVSSELADRLIADAGGGQDQLPLIQHGLMRLHHTRVGERVGAWTLDLKDYPSDVGLAGLLSKHADEVMDRSGAPGVVEAVFRELTEINAEGQAIRRPRTLAQLIAATGAAEKDVRAVVDAFRAQGVCFLKPYGNQPLEPGDLIDVSHEALIRCWDKLGNRKDGWLLREFRNGLIWRALLVQADSFEQDPTNVLGPVATDDRERWMKTRTAAWAERYGGGWDRVTTLIAASVKARDSALFKKRLVNFMFVGLLTSTIGGFGLLQRYYADRENFLWRQQTDLLQVTRQQLEDLKLQKSNATTFESQKDTAARLDQLAEQTRDLAARATTRDTTLADDLRKVTAAITDQAKTLSDATTTVPPVAVPSPGEVPRLYIQIVDEAQREPARALEKLLESRKPEQGGIVVPGIELVKVANTQNVLRCFRTDDCESYAIRLLSRLNTHLDTPQLVLDDQSARYGKSTNIRPRHFELWFAPGPITLKMTSKETS